jgi:hypothetical protein
MPDYSFFIHTDIKSISACLLKKYIFTSSQLCRTKKTRKDEKTNDFGIYTSYVIM